MLRSPAGLPSASSAAGNFPLWLLYQELARNDQLDAEGRLPAVLPLVLYNGDEPWESPLQMGS